MRSADFLGKPFRAGESGTGDGASSSAAAWTLTMVTGARPGAGCREGLASVAGWLPRVSIGCAIRILTKAQRKAPCQRSS